MYIGMVVRGTNRGYNLGMVDPIHVVMIKATFGGRHLAHRASLVVLSMRCTPTGSVPLPGYIIYPLSLSLRELYSSITHMQAPPSTTSPR